MSLDFAKNFRTNFDVLQLDGSTTKIGAEAVTVLELDPTGYISKAQGTIVPTDGTAGYAKGCLFVDTDASLGSILYLNEGTPTSCDFNIVESGASSITGVTAGNGISGGGTSGTVTINAAPSVATSTETITTTSDTDFFVIAPQAGTINGIFFSSTSALTADDTNYITFSATNLGTTGSGTAAMLAATDANTTKSTGGTGLVANAQRTLTLTATGADLVVAAGDRIRIRAAVTGTLAGAVAGSLFSVRYA